MHRAAIWERGVLYQCGAGEVMDASRGVQLVIADPPWVYARAAVEGAAADQYPLLTEADIAAHLSSAAQTGATRIALWHTWPKLAGDWSMEIEGWGRPVTGGSWSKSMPRDSGHFGVGYHWAGCSELVLIYRRKGAHTDRSVPLRNSWVEKPGRHSAKPIGWMRGWVRKWTTPDGIVLEPYAGTATGCAAAAWEGRMFIGSEPDPDRFDLAVERLSDLLGRPK